MHTNQSVPNYTIRDMQPGDYIRVRMRWHEIESIKFSDNDENDYYVFVTDGLGYGADNIQRLAKAHDFTSTKIGDTGV